MNRIFDTIEDMHAAMDAGALAGGDTVTIKAPIFNGRINPAVTFEVYDPPKDGGGGLFVNVPAPRDRPFECAELAPSYPLNHEYFGKQFEKGKDWTVRKLNERRIAMTAEGVKHITGCGSSARLSVVLSELEQEGRIVRNHMPDGIDTYEVVK